MDRLAWRECAGMSAEPVVGVRVVRCQLEASDDSLVAALVYRAFRTACRHPGNSALRVGDDIREPSVQECRPLLTSLPTRG
jgi:hypothetical protein